MRKKRISEIVVSNGFWHTGKPASGTDAMGRAAAVNYLREATLGEEGRWHDHEHIGRTIARGCLLSLTDPNGICVKDVSSTSIAPLLHDGLWTNELPYWVPKHKNSPSELTIMVRGKPDTEDVVLSHSDIRTKKATGDVLFPSGVTTTATWLLTLDLQGGWSKLEPLIRLASSTSSTYFTLYHISLWHLSSDSTNGSFILGSDPKP